jgi:hypothetical protein
MDHHGVTLKRAGEIIGGDKPLSVRTISGYITRGDLEAYGERNRRRGHAPVGRARVWSDCGRERAITEGGLGMSKVTPLADRYCRKCGSDRYSCRGLCQSCYDQMRKADGIKRCSVCDQSMYLHRKCSACGILLGKGHVNEKGLKMKRVYFCQSCYKARQQREMDQRKSQQVRGF